MGAVINIIVTAGAIAWDFFSGKNKKSTPAKKQTAKEKAKAETTVTTNAINSGNWLAIALVALVALLILRK